MTGKILKSEGIVLRSQVEKGKKIKTQKKGKKIKTSRTIDTPNRSRTNLALRSGFLASLLAGGL